MKTSRLVRAATAVLVNNNPATLKELREALAAVAPEGYIERREQEALAEKRKRRDEPVWVGDPPLFVKNLVRKYAKGRIGEFTYRRSATKWSASGHAYTGGWSRGRIVVTAPVGEDRAETSIVVLHEIAHILTPAFTKHGPGFYDALYPLVVQEGLYRAAVARSHRPLRAAASRARAKTTTTAKAAMTNRSSQ